MCIEKLLIYENALLRDRIESHTGIKIFLCTTCYVVFLV